MKRPKPRHKMSGRAKHVRLYKDMLNTTAYRNLCSVARDLLVQLEYRYNGSNNGYIIMSHREALDCVGTNSNRAITKAFRQLHTHGFIKPRKKGGFTVKQRLATEWILSNHEFDGRQPTREYLHWRPTPKVVKPRAVDTVIDFAAIRKVRAQ